MSVTLEIIPSLKSELTRVSPKSRISIHSIHLKILCRILFLQFLFGQKSLEPESSSSVPHELHFLGNRISFNSTGVSSMTTRSIFWDNLAALYDYNMASDFYIKCP